jgi:sulfate adenylyltransferase subunit 2
VPRAIQAIEKVAQQTGKATLFHSASGKDSIALLDLMSPYFDEIVCVYMYVVKDLGHINRHIGYAARKYPNATFVQVPHFALSSYIKIGYMGHAQNPKQKLLRLTDISRAVVEKFGIEWTFYGFKQSDGMNRRLMLRGYEDQAINYKSRKCYPLSTYKNVDVLHYIDAHDLIQPEKYGNFQSNGASPSDLNYLLWLRARWPNDLAKVIEVFPDAERLLFEHDYEADRRK